MSDKPIDGPLAGVRVLDLTAVVSGPFATMWLAEQGADVIKIEPPGLGDQGRYVGPGFDRFSALFATCNRNKRSVALDLRRPEGVAVVLEMAKQVDVLIENFRPGVADRMGLGYEAIAAINPQVIYASINGFGPDGPYAAYRAYDSIIQAGSGLADAQAQPGEEPALVNSIICDKVAGATAAQAITAALYARSRGRGGQKVAISMLEASLAFNWPDLMWNEVFRSEAFKPGLNVAETYRLWKTRDGHIAVVFITGHAFQDWCVALDAEPEIAAETFESEMASRQRWKALFPLWEAKIAGLTTDEALARFRGQAVPCGAVRRRGEIMDDPQVLHCEAVVEVDDPVHGPTRVARPGARFSGHAFTGSTCAPVLGGQSEAVLLEFGLSPERIAELGAANILAQA